MKFLFTTKVGDQHAYIVGHALQAIGHKVHFWFPGDIPQKLTSSIRLHNDRPAVISSRNPQNFDNIAAPVDVVWHRRPSRPVLPDTLHPADIPVAEQEFGYYLDGLRSCLHRTARWVNPLRSYAWSSDKILQLMLAPGCGLKIPDTLASHAPDDIREFAARHAHSGVIFKPFAPAVWQLADGGQAFVPTTLVTTEDLDDDFALRNAPGIYQPLIAKAYELRVTMFGTHAIAIRINSQETEDGRIDWRNESNDALKFEPYTLFPALHNACTALMDKLGIVFGCFDFIVTPDGDTLFLEVNPMGNFLPIETTCPETRMLETFCAFLVNGEGSTRLPGIPSYGDILADPDFQAFKAGLDRDHIAAPPPVMLEAAE